MPSGIPSRSPSIFSQTGARGSSTSNPPASLHRRGPTGEGPEVICADGGTGLPAALPLVYPDIPVRRCRARRIGNIPNKFRKPDREDAKHHLHGPQSHRRARRRTPLRRPTAGCLSEGRRIDPDDLPARFRYPEPDGRTQVRTTDAVERRLGKVRRRTRPMGTFRNRTSMERVPFAILPYRNKRDRTATPFTVTHKP